uniref:Uncharacterized protein n=1 Tax=Onchocerca volvulus TaxID=6282 RepID=A0A8R1TY88_ONCVO
MLKQCTYYEAERNSQFNVSTKFRQNAYYEAEEKHGKISRNRIALIKPLKIRQIQEKSAFQNIKLFKKCAKEFQQWKQ